MLSPSPTGIAGVFVIDTSRNTDERGSFARLFCLNELSAILGSRAIAQVNISRTTRVGAVRGMHYQRAPHAEMKLIRCLRGRVLDVALDLRKGSETFLKWHAEELSAENARVIVIPEGCAHGFQVLEPDSELMYLHTDFYNPASEGGVRHDDARVAISWPLESTDISRRDLSHPLLTEDFEGLGP